MAKFIELTGYTRGTTIGTPIVVNIDEIKMCTQHDEYSLITLLDKTTLLVQESISSIIARIREVQ